MLFYTNLYTVILTQQKFPFIYPAETLFPELFLKDHLPKNKKQEDRAIVHTIQMELFSLIKTL